MRYRRSVNDTEELTDINISPLIDMVFILLIFFIVTTVFVEETGVDVNKPEAAAAVTLEMNSILIAVTAKNEVVYGGKEIGVNGVRPLVTRLLRGGDEMPVIVQGDESADYGIAVRVVGEAKAAGAVTVSLSTEKAG